MGISENIKRLRTEMDWTQEQLAKKLGVTRATVTQWETGWSLPRMGKVEKLASIFGVPVSAIVDDSAPKRPIPPNDIIPVRSEPAFLPLRGRIHAGNARSPEVLGATLVELPKNVADAHPNGYFLEVEGDCMNMVYPEGCLILVDPDRPPANGSIAAVSIDGTDYVMRRMFRTPSTMVLSPESYNPDHADIVITADSDHVVELVGTVVWFQSAREME